jgi:hypothetical protein
VRSNWGLSQTLGCRRHRQSGSSTGLPAVVWGKRSDADPCSAVVRDGGEAPGSVYLICSILSEQKLSATPWLSLVQDSFNSLATSYAVPKCGRLRGDHSKPSGESQVIADGELILTGKPTSRLVRTRRIVRTSVYCSAYRKPVRGARAENFKVYILKQ